MRFRAEGLIIAPELDLSATVDQAFPGIQLDLTPAGFDRVFARTVDDTALAATLLGQSAPAGGGGD